jgi:hypothetical protein
MRGLRRRASRGASSGSLNPCVFPFSPLSFL